MNMSRAASRNSFLKTPTMAVLLAIGLILQACSDPTSVNGPPNQAEAVQSGGQTSGGAAAQHDGEGGAETDEAEKVEVCHMPPGNPANAHTISVDNDSFDDHVAHGDTEGPCESDEPIDPQGGEGGG